MLLEKTKAIAGAAMLSALSLICLLAGTFVPVNTIFFTAFAAYLIGVCANRYNLIYSGMQLVVCVLLDMLCNPDKMSWILYLCFGVYIWGSECIFQKWNTIRDGKRRLQRQLLYNWGLFQIIYIPILIFFSKYVFFGGVDGKVTGKSAGIVGNTLDFGTAWLVCV